MSAQILFGLALLIGWPAWAEEPMVSLGDPAKNLIARAIQCEKLAESGTLRFHIHIEADDPDSLRTMESKNLDYVDFSWAPGKKFRIAMMGKSGPLRTIVSDGKVISTGLNVWDARFAWDYEPHSRDTNFDLRLKLGDEMWVYSHLLTHHLHPLSGFENTMTPEKYASIYRMSAQKQESAQAPGVTRVKLEYPGRSRYFRYVEIEADGDFAFARSNQPPDNMGGGLAFERTVPLQIASVGSIPKSCLVTAKPTRGVPVLPPFRWVSELVADAQVGPLDAAEFDVKYRPSELILWPYGSRLKNFWYGIVDTLEDMWEGISDGTIGD